MAALEKVTRMSCTLAFENWDLWWRQREFCYKGKTMPRNVIRLLQDMTPEEQSAACSTMLKTTNYPTVVAEIFQIALRVNLQPKPGGLKLCCAVDNRSRHEIVFWLYPICWFRQLLIDMPALLRQNMADMLKTTMWEHWWNCSNLKKTPEHDIARFPHVGGWLDWLMCQPSKVAWGNSSWCWFRQATMTYYANVKQRTAETLELFLPKNVVEFVIFPYLFPEKLSGC